MTSQFEVFPGAASWEIRPALEDSLPGNTFASEARARGVAAWRNKNRPILPPSDPLAGAVHAIQAEIDARRARRTANRAFKGFTARDFTLGIEEGLQEALRIINRRKR